MAVKSNSLASNNNIGEIANKMSNSENDLNSISSALNSFIKHLNSIYKQEGGKDNTSNISEKVGTFKMVFKSYLDLFTGTLNLDKDKIKSLKNSSKMTSVIQSSKDVLNVIAEVMGKFAEDLSSKESQFKALNSILTTQKTSKQSQKDSKWENMIITDNETAESGGLLDSINLILNVSNQLNEVKVPKWKAKRKFRKILRTFTSLWDMLYKNFSRYGPETTDVIYSGVKAMEKLTMSLPTMINKITEPLLLVAVSGKIVEKGMEVLCGREAETKDKRILGINTGKTVQVSAKDGLITGILGIVKNLDTLNDYKNFKGITDKLNLFSDSVLKLTKSLAIIAVIGRLAYWGLEQLVGKEGGKDGAGGIIGLILKAFTKIIKHEKTINNASETIGNMAKAVLAMTGTLLLLALAGVFIVVAFPVMSLTLLVMLGLTALLAWLGSRMVKREIKGGAKTFALMGLAFSLFALTVVLLASIGEFTQASWPQILMIGTILAFMVGAFILLGKFSKKMDNATKSLLWIALATAIIGIVAVGLVEVSDLIDGDWGSIFMIGVMMIGIATTMVVISFISKSIKKKDIVTIGILAGIAVVLTGIISTFAIIANNTDMGKLWGVFGMMPAIIGAITAMAVGLGALVMNPVIGILMVVGLAAIAGLSAIAALLAGAVVNLSVVANLVDKYGISNGDELVKKVTAPVNALTVVAKYVAKTDIKTIRKASRRMMSLSWMSVSIGIMAKVLSSIASLRIPVEFDKDGKPTKYETMKEEDFANAANNAATIAMLFTKMCSGGGAEVDVTVNGQPMKIGTIDFDALSNVSRSSRRKFRFLSNIVSSIGNMADTIQKLASLSVPSGFDEEGKPKDYVKMTTTDFTNASQNACTIATTIVGALADETFQQQIDQISKRDAKVMSLVFDAVSKLSGMTDLLSNLARGEFPLNVKQNEDGTTTVIDSIKVQDITNNKENITKDIRDLSLIIIEGMNLQGATLANGTVIEDPEDYLEDMEEYTEHLTKLVTNGTNNVKSIMETYKNNIVGQNMHNVKKCYTIAFDVVTDFISRFGGGKGITTTQATEFDKATKSLGGMLKNINDTDLGKLKVARDLMHEMWQFAKAIDGDFEKLAECINEDLITAIEKLQEVLEKGVNYGGSGGSGGSSSSDRSPADSKSGGPKVLKNTKDKSNENLINAINSLKSEIDKIDFNGKRFNFEFINNTGGKLIIDEN